MSKTSYLSSSSLLKCRIRRCRRVPRCRSGDRSVCGVPGRPILPEPDWRTSATYFPPRLQVAAENECLSRPSTPDHSVYRSSRIRSYKNRSVFELAQTSKHIQRKDAKSRKPQRSIIASLRLCDLALKLLRTNYYSFAVVRRERVPGFAIGVNFTGTFTVLPSLNTSSWIVSPNCFLSRSL